MGKIRKITAMVILMAVTFCVFTAVSVYAEPIATVEVDVSTVTGTTDDYRVSTNYIDLLKRNVQYVLTGNTDKTIRIWGANTQEASTPTYLKLNNVTVGGGLSTYNVPSDLRIEVPANTVNTMGMISANNITVSGTGTLNANINVIQQGSVYMKSGLTVTDTIVNLGSADKDNNIVLTKIATWEGDIVLKGNAQVKLVSDGYAVLYLGQDTKNSSSLTVKDNAKLYVLQKDMDTETSNIYSEGLTVWSDSTISIEDNGYVEVQGQKSKDSTSDGGGIYMYGDTADISVSDNAELKVTSYAMGIYCNNLNITGGKLNVTSKRSTGVRTVKDVNIKNASVDVNSYYTSIYAVENAKIENSVVTAKSENSHGICCLNYDIKVSDSVVKAVVSGDNLGFRISGVAEFTNSWVETAEDTETDFNVTNSVVFKNKVGTVYGNHSIPADVKVASDMSLTIPDNTSVKVTSGKTFTNNGDITLNGTFVNDGGTVICAKHTGGTAKCCKKAICGICNIEYGEFNGDNHSGIKCVEAVPATKKTEGNTEYWYCADCGKYYSDATGKDEIKAEDTVIAKVNQSENTGDALLVCEISALVLSICGLAVIKKKNYI